MEEKTFSEIKVRKPLAIIYYPVVFILKIISKIVFRLRINKKERKGVKPPYLVLANHSSVTDIVFTLSAFLPQRLNIVTSKDLFTWPLFKPLIEKVGCIPKSQCSIDIMSIKTIKAALEQGRCVVLYPEGKTSLDGKELMNIPDSIGKLIKMLEVPVLFSHTEGAYLTKPRYFHGFRRGKVNVKITSLFSKEQTQNLPAKEIAQKVREALRFNDNIYQQENNIKFRTKNPALGLEYILYKCPRCGAEYEMRSTPNELICGACGNTVEYNVYGRFIPSEGSVAFDRIDLWYDYQRKCVEDEISVEGFRISHPVDLLIEKERTFIPAGEGELYIDDTYVGYTGTKDGEPYAYKTAVKNLNTLVTKNKEGVDLIHNDSFYRFMFKEHKYSSKYGLIVEQMYKKLNEKPLPKKTGETACGI